jgi:hypothetical protein
MMQIAAGALAQLSAVHASSLPLALPRSAAHGDQSGHAALSARIYSAAAARCCCCGPSRLDDHFGRGGCGRWCPAGAFNAHRSFVVSGQADPLLAFADPTRPVTSRSTLASPDRWRPSQLGGSRGGMRLATAGARQLELARRDKLWINKMKSRVKREIRETDRLINDFDFNEQVAGAFKQEQVSSTAIKPTRLAGL